MNAHQFMVRKHYHLMWMAKYTLASLWCFVLSLMAWPRRTGLVALLVGYVFAGLASRARRRAMQVLP